MHVLHPFHYSCTVSQGQNACIVCLAEDEPLPGDWKRMPEFDRLLLFRALRPDRLTAAMKKFVTNMIGAKFVTSQPFDLEHSFQDSAPGTPIFVFLSPGVDVVSWAEHAWSCS